MYPRSPARRKGLLEVGGQSVYWEESGAPDGIPALYLHGGPGGGIGQRGYATKLDPDRYRILAFDQRGCGRSTPIAGDPAHDLDSNTTQQLIADMEVLRKQVGVDAWVLNGVSWGATLALAYAQAHPDRVLGIVLMAVTSTRRAEVDWITQGCRILYPEAWDRLARAVQAEVPSFRPGQDRIIEALASGLREPDENRRLKLAAAWGDWEDWHISIGSGGHHHDPRYGDPGYAVPFATLVTHYWANDAFLDPPILDRMEQIAQVPSWLIHGRRDVSGPVDTAWQLHQRWPASHLMVIEDEGHGGPSMVTAWAHANDELANLIDSH